MNEIIRQRRKRWADALRSGKYQQGLGKLNDNNEKYCCLGVGCEVYIKDGNTLEKTEKPENRGIVVSNTIKYNNSSIRLPQEVAKYFGTSKDGRIIIYGTVETSLIRLNDGEKLPFNEIANVIESGDLIEIP